MNLRFLLKKYSPIASELFFNTFILIIVFVLFVCFNLLCIRLFGQRCTDGKIPVRIIPSGNVRRERFGFIVSSSILMENGRLVKGMC